MSDQSPRVVWSWPTVGIGALVALLVLLTAVILFLMRQIDMQTFLILAALAALRL